ncbi:MAG: hypothetical protein IJC82_05555, partial [Firmicutes bacterium]|nr:hypothetical protein [Bacillota bacterium]
MENNEYRFCPKCGHEPRPGAEFCPQCLTRLKTEEPQKETQKASTPQQNTQNNATLNTLNNISGRSQKDSYFVFCIIAAVCALISAIYLIIEFSSFMEYTYYIDQYYPDPFENAPTYCTLFSYIFGILGSLALTASLFIRKKE